MAYAPAKLPIKTEAEASYKGGVLTVMLPKSPEAQNSQKTISVTAK